MVANSANQSAPHTLCLSICRMCNDQLIANLPWTTVAGIDVSGISGTMSKLYFDSKCSLFMDLGASVNRS